LVAVVAFFAVRVAFVPALLALRATDLPVAFAVSAARVSGDASGAGLAGRRPRRLGAAASLLVRFAAGLAAVVAGLRGARRRGAVGFDAAGGGGGVSLVSSAMMGSLIIVAAP
jgi:hypothetical protein